MKNIYNLAALIAARKKAGLSLADIAKKAEVKEKAVSNFEKGLKPRSAWGHRLILAYLEIGTINAEWLQAQIRAFVSENDLTIVERGRSGQRSIVMNWDQVFDLGALLLQACGHNVR